MINPLRAATSSFERLSANRFFADKPVFVNLLKSPGIDSHPDGIDSWAP